MAGAGRLAREQFRGERGSRGSTLHTPHPGLGLPPLQRPGTPDLSHLQADQDGTVLTDHMGWNSIQMAAWYRAIGWVERAQREHERLGLGDRIDTPRGPRRTSAKSCPRLDASVLEQA